MIDPLVLTYAQATSLVGTEILSLITQQEPLPTGRSLGWLQELRTSVNFIDAEGNVCLLEAYFYHSSHALESASAEEKLAWQVDHLSLQRTIRQKSPTNAQVKKVTEREFRIAC